MSTATTSTHTLAARRRRRRTPETPTLLGTRTIMVFLGLLGLALLMSLGVIAANLAA